jgi:hypothetical protein
VIQTCAVACYSLAFTGGFTNYLIAMNWNTYVQTEGAETGGEVGKPAYPLPASVIQPSYGALSLIASTDVPCLGLIVREYANGTYIVVPLSRWNSAAVPLFLWNPKSKLLMKEAKEFISNSHNQTGGRWEKQVFRKILYYVGILWVVTKF